VKRREHIQKRTEYVRGKRGPISFVWGNHVVKPRQRVPGAAGLWSPPPEGPAPPLRRAQPDRHHHLGIWQNSLQLTTRSSTHEWRGAAERARSCRLRRSLKRRFRGQKRCS